MWCSKKNWEQAPSLFKTSGNLNSSAHYSLSFVFIVPIFDDQTSVPSCCPLLLENDLCAQKGHLLQGLCIFRLVIIRSTNASVHNDFPIGPEVPACECFTPGLCLSVDDGSFSELNCGKWPFLNLKLLLKSEGMDQKKRNIRLEMIWQLLWE